MIDTIDRLRAALLLVAAVFILSPAVDVVATIARVGLHSTQGRYEAIAALATSLPFLLLGAGIAAVLTAMTGTRRALKVQAVLNVVGGALLLFAAADLLREGHQLGIASPLESTDAHDIGAWQAAFKLLAGALAFGVIAGGLFRHERTLARVEDDGVAFLVQRNAQG